MAKRYNEGTDQQNLVNDAAKTLFANIRFMSVDDPIRSIAITSSIPNEGKSFVSINLAQAIASADHTVLLIEGDLRKRSLAAALGIHPKHGLYSVLSKEVPFSQAAVATPQHNMYFLDSEPQIPNPPDLFSSERFASFLKQASDGFDYVIVDTAPVGTFVDAAIIASYVDATFLVVRENFTKRNLIANAYDQLVQANANVAGVIMNDCGAGDDHSYYYDYYTYYKDYNRYSRDNGESSATKEAFRPTNVNSANFDAASNDAEKKRSNSSMQTVNGSTSSKANGNQQRNNSPVKPVISGFSKKASRNSKPSNSTSSNRNSGPVKSNNSGPVKSNNSNGFSEVDKYRRDNYSSRSNRSKN